MKIFGTDLKEQKTKITNYKKKKKRKKIPPSTKKRKNHITNRNSAICANKNSIINFMMTMMKIIVRLAITATTQENGELLYRVSKI